MNRKTDLSYARYHDTIAEKYDYAVLPWGATEPHNHHLPYLTDCYLSYHIAADSVQKAYEDEGLRGMVLPYIPLGSQNPGQFDLPFCLHATYQTQYAILKDIVSSLIRQSIDKLFVINGHGGNNFRNMVRDLSVDYPDFLIVIVDWFKVEPQESYFEVKDDHAGEQETSVLMYYRPELVDLAVAGKGDYTPFRSESLNKGIGWTPRNWMKVSTDTGTADPTRATAQKGERYAKAVVDKIVRLFSEVVKEEIYR